MIQSEEYYQKMEEAYSKRIDELMKENAELTKAMANLLSVANLLNRQESETTK